MPAGVTSGLGCSSTVSSTIPFFVFMGIGTISSANLSDGTVLLKCFKVRNIRNYQKVDSRWIITLNIETRREFTKVILSRQTPGRPASLLGCTPSLLGLYSVVITLLPGNTVHVS